MPAEMSVSRLDDWTLWHCAETGSTNDAARRAPAWTVVRADRQRAGRGRQGRTWVSGEGGLWLSFVIPVTPERRRWEALPLAAGWSLIREFEAMGARGLRLRWPNDIMAGRRKLAGLLVEQFEPGTAVVGIGINVTNDPAAGDPSLKGASCRLADLAGELPATGEILRRLAAAIRRMRERLAAEGFQGMASEMNRAWGGPRRVALDLDGGTSRITWFHGVDGNGDLRIRDEAGGEERFSASQVKLLRELTDEKEKEQI